MKFEDYRNIVISELAEVFDRITGDDLQPALEAIKNANKIFLYAGGREGLGLKFFAMRLMHLGKSAHWAWDDTVPACRKGDVFFFSGGAGICGHVNYIAEQAKKTGAKIVVLTASLDSLLAKMADVVIYMPAQAYLSKGDVVVTQQLMGNLYEQATVLLYDIMAMMLKDQMGISSEEMEKRHRNFE